MKLKNGHIITLFALLAVGALILWLQTGSKEAPVVVTAIGAAELARRRRVADAALRRAAEVEEAERDAVADAAEVEDAEARAERLADLGDPSL